MIALETPIFERIIIEMELQIKIADIVVKIHSSYNLLKMMEETLPNYVISATNPETPAVDITITELDLLKENDKLQNKADTENEMYRYNDPKYLIPQCTIAKIADVFCSHDIILLHGAVVATGGQAYMFIAPSGVGKTTRARLWVKEIPNSVIINGDKPFIRISNSTAYAYGTPWCGKEGENINTKRPLRAIFLLERAETDKDCFIKEVSFSEAFLELLEQTYLPDNKDALQQTISLLNKLKEHVRIFRFRSTPTKAAIHMAWEKVKSEDEKNHDSNLAEG